MASSVNRTKYNVLKTGVNALPVTATQTNYALSSNIDVRSGDRIRFDVHVSTATVGSGITFKVQTSAGPDTSGNPVWVDTKTLAGGTVAASTYYSITFNPEVVADQTYLPLPKLARVVVTTAAGASLTVRAVYVTE